MWLIILAPAIPFIARNFPPNSKTLKCDSWAWCFDIVKTCVGSLCLFLLAPHYLLIAWRGNYNVRYQIQRVRSHMISKASTELLVEEAHSWGLWGAVLSQSLEKSNTCLEKIFRFFLPSLMSLWLLWRGSEWCLTLLEKSTLVYFCRANTSPHRLFFIIVGFLKIIRTSNKKEMFLCQHYFSLWVFGKCMKQFLLITVKRSKYIGTHVNRGRGRHAL